MFRKILLFVFISLPANFAFADRYDDGRSQKEVEDFFSGLKYQEIAGSSVTANSVKFYGYGTDGYFIVKGGTATFSGSWSVNGSTKSLSDSEYETFEFHVPVSSPTILYWDLARGATVQYSIGGLK